MQATQHREHDKYTLPEPYGAKVTDRFAAPETLLWQAISDHFQDGS